MAKLTRAQLEAYFQTGDIPTQSQFAEVFQSSVNIVDDNFTKVNETELTIAFGGSVNADCTLGKSFSLTLTENVLIDASGMVNGETYTFIIEQGAIDYTVTLRPTFVTSASFVMVSGANNHSMFTCYCHNGTLFCFPQVDFS